MTSEKLLQKTVDQFWDTIPPVWGRVRGVARANATQVFNLTLIQFHILRHIHKGAHSVVELADRQQISRPAISKAVETLVEKGLVSRITDETDRRYVRLELTESGDHLLADLFVRNRQWMVKKMEMLSDDELEKIIDTMNILKKTFDAPVESLNHR